MTIIRTVVCLLVTGLASAVADEPSCTDCLQEGLAARESGEPERALMLFDRGCEQGSIEACEIATRMLARGEGVPRDPSRAVNMAIRGCGLGQMKMCRDVGVYLVRADDPELAARGLQLLLRSCEGNYAEGCGGLGMSLLRGYGGPADREAAMRVFAKACELGYPPGCTAYGLSFFSGEGADPVRARSLVRQGCEAGDAEGCGHLGVAQRDGLGGPADVVAANQNLERACDGEYLPACSDLGAAYFSGAGGLGRDVQRAAELFAKACDGGWQKACDNQEILARALEKPVEEKQDKGWSTSMEGFSFSTGKKLNEDGDSAASTTIGSMQIGSGAETATFSDVQSSCGAFRLTLAFGSAAANVRQCLGATDQRRVKLVIEEGRATSGGVDPDDAAGRCVVNALANAGIQGLTCSLEATVSR